MVIVAAYFAICIIYTIVWAYINGRYQEAFCRFIFALFIPVISFVYFFIIDRPSLYSKHESLDKYYIGNEQRAGDLLYLRPVDEKSELNKVPMEEALNINDYNTRRKMVMDTLQYDTLEYLDSLKKALANEDTETSHYAMAVIMDIQSKLSESILKAKAIYNKNKKDKMNISRFEEALEKIIFSGVFDKRNLTKYYEDYRNLSDDIFKGLDIDEIYYINRIKFDFKTMDFDHAYELCNKYKVRYPYSEDMVIYTIKYCVMTSNREKLEAFFLELKDLPVKLTQNSLQYVRFLNN